MRQRHTSICVNVTPAYASTSLPAEEVIPTLAKQFYLIGAKAEIASLMGGSLTCKSDYSLYKILSSQSCGII
jgi:hypothetical protein